MTSKSSKETNNFKFSGFIINGGLIFIITLMFYYVMAILERLKYEAMGVPTELIDYPFYSFVENTEVFIFLIFPIIFFTGIGFIMLIKRLEYEFRQSYSRSPYKHTFYYKHSIKKERDRKSRVIRNANKKFRKSIRSCYLYGIIYLSFYGIYSKFAPNVEYIIPTFLITGLSILFFAIYLTTYYLFTKKSIEFRVEEKWYAGIAVIFAGIIVVTQSLIIGFFSHEQNRPLEMIIREEVEESEEFYTFDYLLGEKGNSGIWLKLGVSKKYNDENQKTIPIFISQKIEIKELKNESIRKITVNRDLNIKEFKINLSFRDKKMLEQSLLSKSIDN